MAKARAPRADGEATRARLLESAGRRFAAHGFAETTGKDIAAVARADLASINYHFGSRAGLYLAVLAEAHRRFVSLSDLSALAEGDLPPAAQLEGLIAGVVERAASLDGWPARVLARELLSPSSHLETFFRTEVLPKIARVRRIVAAVAGLPEEHPALPRCLLSVVGPCAMLLVAGQGLPGPLRQVLAMPRAQLVRHLHGFAMAGLGEIARQYRDGELEA